MSKSAKRDIPSFLESFQKADIANTSAALAFHTLLGLVPLVAFVLWYLRNLGINRGLRVQVREFILHQFDFGSGEEFLKAIERLTSNVSSKGLNTIILSVLIYTTFSLAKRSGDALDRVLQLYHQFTPWSFKRTVVILTIKRGLALLAFPLFILVSILVSSWLKEDSWFRFLFEHKTVGPWLARPIPWLIDGFAIFMLYLLIPKQHMGLSRALCSAAIAGPLFEATKYFMATYAKNAISVQKIYGALATIPLFIVWIQLSWFIVLIAPLITGHFAKVDVQSSSQSPPFPSL